MARRNGARNAIREIASDILACSNLERRAYFESEFMEHAYRLIGPAIFGRVPYDNYEDVVADSAERVLRGLRQGKLRYASNADQWVCKITANIRNDYYTRNGRYPHVPLEIAEMHSNGQNPEDEAERQFEWDALHKAIKELSQRQQEVIELIYFRDFTIQEVAKITGKSEGNIKTTAYRARNSIREKLLGVL